jgi:hypothetical protein
MRNNILGKQKPGGAEPTVYIGQAIGPFWLPCHKDKNYAGRDTVATEVVQCRGAAIFRSNIEVAEKMPEGILVLPKDDTEVFASKEEFLAYYYSLPIEVMEALPPVYYQSLLAKEMADSRIKKVNL